MTVYWKSISIQAIRRLSSSPQHPDQVCSPSCSYSNASLKKKKKKKKWECGRFLGEKKLAIITYL